MAFQLLAVIFVAYITQSFAISYPIPAENASVLLTSLMQNYNKEIIPNFNGEPVNCTIKIVVRDMVPVDEIPMHYTMDFLLIMVWTDYRLQYDASPIKPPEFNETEDSIALPLESTMVNKIWIPNIFFPYGKKSYSNNVISDNSMLLLQPSGKVVFTKRISLASFCPMKLVFYPFDIQDCEFEIESFSYSKEYLHLKWINETETEPVETPTNLHMREFSNVEVDTTARIVIRNGATYDSLVIKLKLFRFLAFYFLRDYFPCILIVVLSWISFWINYKSTPARVALGITTVLTIVTLSNGIRANSPPEGLFRSLDYYLLICNLFVFAALAEYALVGQTNAQFTRYRAPSPTGKKAEKKENGSTPNGGDHDDEAEEIDEKKQNMVPPISERVVPLKTANYSLDDEVNKSVTSQESGVTRERGLVFIGETHVVDQIAKIIFPLSFSIFNAVYFLIHRLHPDTVD